MQLYRLLRDSEAFGHRSCSAAGQPPPGRGTARPRPARGLPAAPALQVPAVCLLKVHSSPVVPQLIQHCEGVSLEGDMLLN
ncbi:hypothetical protein AV530_015383 [Patagioenas fasciata monilis]|uniref:Uncharacterized protein n=1 Tax=Patagioenas fasciata monilis TaxID=372326 RepID=A0A1V4JV51_PATFA|nr:hypothetical protein AV530_015383 [Patagioenas fasciata monilis]